MLKNYRKFTTLFNAMLVNLINKIIDLTKYKKNKFICDVNNSKLKRIY